MNESGLSHVDSDGRARMVDVGAKRETTRVAVAAGVLRTTPEVVALVRADGLPKADVLSTARIAGIGGAKKTSELIPLCHPLPLTSVSISFDLAEDTIAIDGTPRSYELIKKDAVSEGTLTLDVPAGIEVYSFTFG